jgi:1-acyl-sn-glycerol-3-phosphate acyltransferase
MKQWSLGYEIIRTYVRFAFWLTHKKVTVTGKGNIPKGKPVIFAPNHQNALMDPLAIVCTNPLQSVWLARADIFKLKATQPILKYLKILPVYRIRDGKENLSNNEFIFGQVIHVLESKLSIALFPEAAHSGRRQMLPHKKAIPRIALEAEEKNNFNLDLQIVPVGIYYDHYWDFNRSLIIEYGMPIAIDKYRDVYYENTQKALISLRDEIHSQLEPLTLNIKSPNHYHEYETMRLLAGEAYSSRKLFHKNPTLQLFYAEKEMMDKIWKLEETSPEYFERILSKVSEYSDSLLTSGFTDQKLKLLGNANWLILLTELFLILFSLPIFMLGFIFNALPLFIPRRILGNKVRDKAFLSTFNFVIGLIVFPIYYILCFSLILITIGSWTSALLAFILMPFVGKAAFQLLVLYKNSLIKLKSILRTKAERNTYKMLVEKRKNLIQLIIEKIIL